MKRRDFLSAGAAALAGPLLFPGCATYTGNRVGPNERIVMGAIGIGGMGRYDLGNFLTHDDVQVVAVCDVDAQRLDFAKGSVDQHYENTDCAAYPHFEELIARDDIDAVLIATPDHWHAYLSIAAAQAGKDVYCEKPISLTVEEGRIVADEMKRLRRVYQSGTQRRSIPCFRYAVDTARSAKLGRIHTIHTYLGAGPSVEPQPDEPVPAGFDYDRWLGQAPDKPYTTKRCHGTFRWIYDYSGGKLTDIGAHFNDLAQWGNDSEDTGPIHWEGSGTFPAEGLFDTVMNYSVSATYKSGVKLVFHDFEPRAVKFEGDEGWISVNDDGVLEANPVSLLENSGVEQTMWNFMTPHQRDFLDCVRSRKTPIAPPEVAHRSTTVCHIGNICLRLGRALEWDPAKERFVGDDEANAMLSREARSPWSLDTLV